MVIGSSYGTPFQVTNTGTPDLGSLDQLLRKQATHQRNREVSRSHPLVPLPSIKRQELASQPYHQDTSERTCTRKNGRSLRDSTLPPTTAIAGVIDELSEIMNEQSSSFKILTTTTRQVRTLRPLSNHLRHATRMRPYEMK
ncbi:hypothetical protein Pyn_35638 [Prunus yedoensis var. nudiflora]|uniref:Uncharacterized protein n=1 Tax=Prunus yedoensis var. nudiflora TaxID=2094558 RepID=A0A314Z446_PRUYE|nr:hypothetical protein Pyn_35638 [Prunus yedoensis var. nudiflora]